MNPQMSLLEGAANPKLLDDLFFALMPDEQTAARITELGQQLRLQHGIKSALIRQERLHVTLQHVGTFPGGVPDAIVAMAQQAVADMNSAAFDVAFDHVLSFARSRNRPCVLAMHQKNAALQTLQTAVEAKLKLANLLRGSKLAFTPHVTLFYDDKGIPEHVIPTISWNARELVLLRSRKGQGYTRLGSWVLS